jgi:hypothetical protein
LAWRRRGTQQVAAVAIPAIVTNSAMAGRDTAPPAYRGFDQGFPFSGRRY